VQYVQVQQPPTNGMSVASLVLGILWLGGIGSLLALIFGIVGKKQARERNQRGGGMAVAGIVLGLIGLIGLIVAALLLTALVGVRNSGSRNSSTSSACILDAAAVNSALEVYYAQNKAYPPALSELYSGANPLLKYSPTFGGKEITYDPSTGILTVTC